jgi:spore coat polysaccharide biosynthesis predicted glycosyltransferase SpsG
MRLHLRADASVALGLGHVLRSVALAENARERDIDVRFVVGGAEFGHRAVIARGFAARPPTNGGIDWSADLDPGDLVVIDGPHLTHDVGPAHDRRARVAVIDDADGSHPAADVVVCADRAVIPTTSTTQRRLVGPDHALVRAEFRHFRGPAAAEPREVLTALGGTDPHGRLQALTVAVARQAQGRPVRSLHEALADTRTTVPEALVTAGAAVSAAGTMAWELLCLGVPSALVVAADDQEAPARIIDAAGAAIVLGTDEDAVTGELVGLEALFDPSARQALSERGRALVDGGGAARVLDALLAA